MVSEAAVAVPAPVVTVNARQQVLGVTHIKVVATGVKVGAESGVDHGLIEILLESGEPGGGGRSSHIKIIIY